MGLLANYGPGSPAWDAGIRLDDGDVRGEDDAVRAGAAARSVTYVFSKEKEEVSRGSSIAVTAEGEAAPNGVVVTSSGFKIGAGAGA